MTQLADLLYEFPTSEIVSGLANFMCQHASYFAPLCVCMTVDLFRQVTGFSVSGRVLASPGGNGLDAAAVYLDGKLATNTRPDGTYILENMKAGSYKIQVQASMYRSHRQFRDFTAG